MPRTSLFTTLNVILLCSIITCTAPARADSPLTGSVTKVVIPEGLGEQANKLTLLAYEQDDTGRQIEALVKKMNSTAHKAGAAAKEFAYTMVPYRGFGPSKSGANVLLEQVKKVNTLAGAEYLKQRCMDELHTKVVTNLLQISQGIDTEDKLQGALLIENARLKLAALLGDEKASETVKTVTDWSKEISVPAAAYEQPQWDVGPVQQNVRVATGTSVARDPVFAAVVTKLKKYNRGKFMTSVGSAVESTCAIGSFMAPGFLIPFAVDAANGAFVVATGGTEETKMLNELYYAKRMESRWKRLNEESQLALTAYEMAIAKKSPALMACAESIMQQLCGADNTKVILGQQVLPPCQPASTDGDKTNEAPVSLFDVRTEEKPQKSTWYSRHLERMMQARAERSKDG